MYQLANHISYNLNLHEIPASELLPEFMIELSQVVDPEQQTKEAQSIHTFLTWLAGLGGDYLMIVYSFQQKLLRKHYNMPDGRFATIRSYLDHMDSCPTQTEKISRMAELKHILSIDNTHTVLADQQLDEPVMRILGQPARYTSYLQEKGDQYRKEKEQDQKIADFVGKTREVINYEQLLQELQQELPEFHATLLRFREFLGVDYSGRSMFAELISQCSREICFGGRAFSIKELIRTLNRKLNSVILLESKGKFEGVYIDNTASYRGDFNRVSLSNPHLNAVLPLLAIKHAQLSAQIKKYNNQDKYMVGYDVGEVAKRCQRLNDELAKFYRDKVGSNEKALQEIAKDKDTLKSTIGVTDEEIARLVVLAEGRKDREGFITIDSYLYNVLFNALVLTKQGKIDMRSPSFKTLLKSLFPNKPEAFWQNLWL